ncbi:hypothetical protein LOZ12_005882 [Ophidiomyces ophidiicola]|uniref:Uncharacterized protein n=1 Tax=Ophidiomyces ophidiicola TaxID=1387563 RepID=A0ACB8UMZ6_9EURO|nr:hypothetical protein LOZ64_006480 [Ophidiomyces ophidiicola]KAI1938360.1 hypothetical protein LOZ62_005294 [Ophidiomyces ophidiicola]KAI1947671.1 hypothetical protein LOZ59_006561 [Ophidiomyces ophidiicola]KAI1964387.1 hypothetical protein LOZ56_006225 [Ophidiomyces ophidiicola]KAI1999925.1 hypothetical protein LOZ50_006367 [Ophidiomyces ophidiicola]
MMRMEWRLAVARHVDKLGPDIHCLKISADGDLISVSTDDPTWEVRYPEYPGPLADCEVAYRSELTETDRLQVCTDLVEYNPRHAGEKKEVVAFKYTIYQQRVEYIWRELHTLKALQGHESFVAFHRVVLDDVSKKVLGFTSQYIAGGTLENYRDRPFYFNWLKLTDAIDELNLGFGIMHQDVAPRNILFEPSSNNLKVFDFDRSCLIGDQQPGRNDVDGVIFTLYETLTKDGHFRRVPFHQQQVGNVEEMEDWPLVVPLEEGKGGITAYRSFLAEWAEGRRTTRVIKHHSEAKHPVSFPTYPKLTPFTMEVEGGQLRYLRRRRAEVVALGQYVTRWERPAQKE